MDANEEVEQNITNFSRGSYDLLIRPENARTDLEKELDLIEENYLGVGDGGITIDEWEFMKNHPDVEFAAPVASVGLFTARERTFMYAKDPMDRLYFEVDYSTNDGIRTYSRQNPDWLFDFGIAVEETLQFPSSVDVMKNYFSYDTITFKFPISYHQVVAVDPNEEEKITGFDLQQLAEEEIYDRDAYGGGEHSIPIMSLADTTVPVELTYIIDKLDEVSHEEIEEWRGLFNNKGDDHPDPWGRMMFENPKEYEEIVQKNVMNKRLYQESEHILIPEKDHSPFRQEILYLDEDMELRLENEVLHELGHVYNPHTQRIGYQLGPNIYEIIGNNKLAVKQTGTDELYGAPTYRKLEKIEFFELELNEEGQIVNDDDYFNFTENGTFSIEENTSDLASSPLGIYGREAPYLADDPDKTLHPSAVPGSFINTPAHGLISIDHASTIKGDEPIDAIRVKVAGIDGYDKKAADLIESLASEFEEQGFTVDIVAGASLQDLTVEVEGIGDVIQSFTTLGAADTVVSSWNAIQIGLTILYGLIALIFVSFMFFNLLMDRKKDEQLLAQLGWSEKWIRKTRNREWRTLLGVPMILVSLVFASVGFWQGDWTPFILSFLLNIVFIILYFIALSLTNRQKRTLLKQRKSITLQNIRYYRNQLLAAGFQLFLTTIVTCFLPFFLIEHVQMTKQTRLGAYVHGEIEGIFIVVIVLLYVLSVTTIYQTFRRLWEHRAAEIKLFQTIGWDRKFVRNYFLKEIIIWAGGSAFVGWLISIGITVYLFGFTQMTLLLQIGGLTIVFGLALILSLVTLGRVKNKGGSMHAHDA